MEIVKMNKILSLVLVAVFAIGIQEVNGQNSSSMVDKLIQDTQKGELYRTELIKGNIKLK
jgi:hypothetical protein